MSFEILQFVMSHQYSKLKQIFLIMISQVGQARRQADSNWHPSNNDARKNLHLVKYVAKLNFFPGLCNGYLRLGLSEIHRRPVLFEAVF